MSLHFIIEGRWFTERIQNFLIEHNLISVNKMFDSLKPKPTSEQRRNILIGKAQFLGNTLCNNPDCTQCKKYRKDGGFRYENVPDVKYQKRLTVHQKYLKENYFIVDDNLPVTKRIVLDLIMAKATRDKIKAVRYNLEDKFERLHSTKLNKSYLEALDNYEFAKSALYTEFGISRDKKYDIGSREWRQGLEVETILDVINTQALYDKEMMKLIRDCRNDAISTAIAAEQMFTMVERGRNMESRASSMLTKLVNDIESPKKATPTKETVKIGKYDVPKHLIEDYVSSVKMSNISAMIFKAKYGTLDPVVEQRKFQARVDLHKKIFVALKLPYHQKIDHRKKLTKQDEASIEFQSALSDYMEKDTSI